MAHFAELDNNNKVLRVIVIDNNVTHDENNVEQEELGIAFCKSLFGQDTNWVQTSFNLNIRKRFASVGYEYHPDIDAFMSPQPHPGFTLDKENLVWVAPIEEPEFNSLTHQCYWSEEENNWVVEKRKISLEPTE
jgi:hypothetical protein